jgi:hypothetical protein
MNRLSILKHSPDDGPFYISEWANYRKSLGKEMSQSEVERTLFSDYSATIVVGDNSIPLKVYLEFESNEDMTLFLLRWA